MKNIILPVCLFVFTTIIIGCDSAGVRRKLVAADALIEDNPDSALSVLSSVMRSDISSDADMALFTLLDNQARYKLNRKASASELDFCVDYYTSHSNPRLLQRSYYYRAAINEEGDEASDVCIEDYKKAESLIDNKSDVNIVYRLYNSMACLNLEYGLGKDAEYSARKGMEIAYKTGDVNKIMNAYNVMASVMNFLDNADSMFYYINEAQELLPQCTDEEKSNYYYNWAFFYEDKLENKETAEMYYKKATEISHNDNALLALASLYVEQKRYDEANELINQIICSSRTDIMGMAYDLLCDIYVSNDDYHSAYQTREVSDSILYMRMFLDKDIELNEIQTKYNNELLKSEHKKFRWRIVILVFSIITISLLLFIVILIRIRNKERVIKILEDNLADINRFVENLKLDKEKTILEKVAEYSQIVEKKQVLIKELEKKLSKVALEKHEKVAELKELKNNMEIMFYVLQNEEGILTDVKNRNSLIVCYRNIDEDFIEKVDMLQTSLTLQEKILTILYRIDKTPDEIKLLLGLSNDAYRQLKSRTLKKLRTDKTLLRFCDNIG